MRAEPATSPLLERAPREERLFITGSPGSGKTSALAERAIAESREGMVVVICSHASSCAAFRNALGAADRSSIVVDTLAGHMARWMRCDLLSSGAAADLRVGSDADSSALLQGVARPILDMTWRSFESREANLDLPLLGKPDVFLDEVSSLFRLLRRTGVTPEDFVAGCRAGLAEFYGQGVEQARVRCADPDARSRASKRGREALGASPAALVVQKRAEADLAEVLSFLYAEYRTATRGAAVLGREDVIDEGIAWLREEPAAAMRIAASVRAVIVDDADDAEPAIGVLLDLLESYGLKRVWLAGWPQSAIDGFGGRRSIIDAALSPKQLVPRVIPADGSTAHRFADESAEADFIAGTIGELSTNGVEPAAIAVLARDEHGAAAYAALLEARGVAVTAPPCRWQAPKDIHDLLALAAIVEDPYDQAHLLRVLSSPLVGLNDRTVWQLCRDPAASAQLSLDLSAEERVPHHPDAAAAVLARNALLGSVDFLLDECARAALTTFRGHWERWRRACAERNAAAALGFLIEAAGYRAHWSIQPEWKRRRLEADGQRVVAAAAGMGSQTSLRDAVAALEDDHPAAPPHPDRSSIACLPIVEAKGLRWPYVFVAGVAHERFPRVYVSRAMAFSKRFGLIVRENVAGGAAQSAKFAWYYAKFGAKARYLEEEARALRYALGRAERRSWATGFGKPPVWASDQDLLAAHGV